MGWGGCVSKIYWHLCFPFSLSAVVLRAAQLPSRRKHTFVSSRQVSESGRKVSATEKYNNEGKILERED